MRTNETNEADSTNEASEARNGYYSKLKEFLLNKETAAEVSDQETTAPKEFSTAREAARELARVAAEADRLPATSMLVVEEKILKRLAAELERLTTE